MENFEAANGLHGFYYVPITVAYVLKFVFSYKPGAEFGSFRTVYIYFLTNSHA